MRSPCLSRKTSGGDKYRMKLIFKYVKPFIGITILALTAKTPPKSCATTFLKR